MFPLQYFSVTKLIVFFNFCTKSCKTSRPQNWLWIWYKHYWGKRIEASANNKILKYTTCQNRWVNTSRHEHIQLLPHIRFWFKNVLAIKNNIYSKPWKELCECSLPLIDFHCQTCDSHYMVTLTGKVDLHILQESKEHQNIQLTCLDTVLNISDVCFYILDKISRKLDIAFT